jgi:hypothetical protein
MQDDHATAFLAKLRRFAQDELEDEERTMLGALLGPGIAAIYAPSDEVEAYDGRPRISPSLALVAEVLKDIDWSVGWPAESSDVRP